MNGAATTCTYVSSSSESQSRSAAHDVDAGLDANDADADLSCSYNVPSPDLSAPSSRGAQRKTAAAMPMPMPVSNNLEGVVEVEIPYNQDYQHHDNDVSYMNDNDTYIHHDEDNDYGKDNNDEDNDSLAMLEKLIEETAARWSQSAQLNSNTNTSSINNNNNNSNSNSNTLALVTTEEEKKDEDDDHQQQHNHSHKEFLIQEQQAEIERLRAALEAMAAPAPAPSSSAALQVQRQGVATTADANSATTGSVNILPPQAALYQSQQPELDLWSGIGSGNGGGGGGAGAYPSLSSSQHHHHQQQEQQYQQQEQQYQQYQQQQHQHPLHQQHQATENDYEVYDCAHHDNDEDFHEQIDNIPVEHIEVVQYNRNKNGNSNNDGSNQHRNTLSMDALRSSSHHGYNNGYGHHGHGHRRDASDQWSVTSGLTQAQFHFSQLDVSRLQTDLQTDDSLSDFYTENGGDLNGVTPVAVNGRGIVVTPQQRRPDAESVTDAVTPVTNHRRRVRDYPLTLTANDGSTRQAMYSGPLMAGDGVTPLTDGSNSHGLDRGIITNSPVPVTGIGVLKFPETGDMYMGEVVHGEMHGVGTYTCAASSPASSPSRKSGKCPSTKSAQKKRKGRAYKVLKGFFHHNVYTGWENKNVVGDGAEEAIITNTDMPLPPL
jgi:hypothetical protein